MDHSSGLVTTIVGALALAFVLGTLAHRLRISPLVGYLLAGVLVGPFTPGFVANQGLADELAEIGVVLLMFGVGLHFSLKDLLAVKAIAVPGALLQMSFGTLLGLGLARTLGWSLASGLVFGLALSVASTVVTLRALQDRRLIETERGRIAVGWLVVEDFAMVLALVLLPAFAGLLGLSVGTGGGDQLAGANEADLTGILLTIAITLGKIAAFVALMLLVGRRVIPWLLHYVVHTGSRELFRLAVLVIALGVAYGAAALFGVSFALGAFFAGMVLSESPLSQQAAAESLPLRDAFAVLFFVSVGMLFDPRILLADPWPILATFLIVTVGKSLPPFAIAMLFRRPMATAVTMAASLAQIGEFSFILASLGVDLHLLDEKARDFILAGSILSIMVNPFLFAILDRVTPWLERREKAAGAPRGRAGCNPRRADANPIDRPCGAGRLWAGGKPGGRSPAEGRAPLAGHRGSRRDCSRAEGKGRGNHRRQRDIRARRQGRQHPQGALAGGGDTQRVGGRRDRRTGACGQSHAGNPGPRPFRRGSRLPQGIWRRFHHHGRTRDRAGDDRPFAGPARGRSAGIRSADAVGDAR